MVLLSVLTFGYILKGKSKGVSLTLYEREQYNPTIHKKVKKKKYIMNYIWNDICHMVTPRLKNRLKDFTKGGEIP